MENKEKTQDKKIIEIRKAGHGSGVGLKLVSELALLAEIKIDFRVNPEGGTIVILDFPSE